MNDRYMVISPDTLEAMRRAGHAAKLEARIEKLEADILKYSSAVADAQMHNEELNRALNRVIDRWEIQSVRIEKLETALREIDRMCDTNPSGVRVATWMCRPRDIREFISKTLEGKDD